MKGSSAGVNVTGTIENKQVISPTSRVTTNLVSVTDFNVILMKYFHYLKIIST